MSEKGSIRVTPPQERRAAPTTHSRTRGETTVFDLGSINSGKVRDEEREPMFLVCRGLQKGRPIPLQEGTWSVGRGPVCDISLPGRGISRTHLRVSYSVKSGVVVSDAASTNGLFVNGARVERRTLRNNDVVQLGPETVLRFMLSPSCETALRVRQYENSIVDDLTGVHNRRYLLSSLDHEMAFAARHGQPLCLMLVDIDHFKLVNDRRGHQAGDAVIKQLAERIADSLRSEDVFARVGGEEFAILTRCLHRDGAREAAERVRRMVQTRPFHWQNLKIACTISIGGTMLKEKEALDAGTLLRRADEHLYRAKETGRNRVIID